MYEMNWGKGIVESKYTIWDFLNVDKKLLKY